MAIDRTQMMVDGGDGPAYNPIVGAEQFQVKTPVAPGKLPTTSVGGFREIDYNARQAEANAKASLESRVAVSRFIDNLQGNEQAFYQSVINSVGGLQNLTQSQLNTLFTNMQTDMRDPNATVKNLKNVTTSNVNNWIKKNLGGTGVSVGPTTILKPGDEIGTGNVITPSNITNTTGNPNDVNNNGIPDNLEAAQLQVDAQAKAAAELRRLQLEDAAARGKAAIDLLKETIKQYFTMSGDDAFVNDLSSIIDTYAREGYDAATISVMLPQTQPYKTRFAGNEARLKAGLSALSPSNYIQAEETYNDILKRYNLSDVATRETFASLIGGQVSADEFADRIVNVYDRVRNADPALRAELDRVEGLGGDVTDADFVKALLTGDKGAAQLKRKIATAEIAAEARIRSEQLKERGYKPGLTVDTAEDLQRLGVTREQARAGFEQIALTQPRLTQLSEMYTGETPEATGLQRELEAEQFQGLQSQRRRRFAEQETTAFMGQSGTAAGISLGRRRTGQI